MEVREATYEDIEAVALFAKHSFRETFFESAGYGEEEFQIFIDEEYSEEKLKR